MPEMLIISLHTIIAFLSITLNASLLISIINRTPKSSRSFSIFMATHAVFDLIGTLACFMTMARVLLIDYHFVLISHGPCSMISSRICYLAYDVFLSCASSVFWTNMASFYARLLILKHGKISIIRVIIILSLSIIPHVSAFFIFLATSQIPDNQARHLLVLFNPDYVRNVTITATDHILSPGIAYCHILICVFVFPAYVGVWMLRSATLRILNDKSCGMSMSTKNLHKAFVKVLTLQAITPLLSVISVSTYIIMHLFQIQNPLLESSMMMSGELPAIISPIIVFSQIPSYRRIARKIMTLGFLSLSSSTEQVHSSINQYSLQEKFQTTDL